MKYRTKYRSVYISYRQKEVFNLLFKAMKNYIGMGIIMLGDFRRVLDIELTDLKEPPHAQSHSKVCTQTLLLSTFLFSPIEIKLLLLTVSNIFFPLPTVCFFF